MNVVWRQLAQRQFSAAETTLSSDTTLSPEAASRVRALLTLHRDGVSAAMRLVPLPHDVFLQCFERTASIDEKRNIALTQLRACAADKASAVAYEQALELTLFHVLIPRGEFDAAEALLAADRVLTSEHREFFALLLHRAKQESMTINDSNVVVVVSDTNATPVVVSRKLTFDEVPRGAPDDAVVPKRSMSWQRYLLLTLLGASTVGVVYRAFLWWTRRRRPAR
jgi:hypothetical protein